MARHVLGCGLHTSGVLHCRPHSLQSRCSIPMASLPTQHPQPHSSFEIIGGARDLFLPALANLARPYSPYPLFASNRHLETIFASFFRSIPQVKYRRQCLRTKDDGAVALDWVSGDDRLLPPTSPLLILLVRSFTTFPPFTMPRSFIYKLSNSAARFNRRKRGFLRQTYVNQSPKSWMARCRLQ